MKKAGIFKKMLLILLSVILGAAPCVSEAGTLDVFAKTAVGTGSYADQESEVVGTWSANGNTYTNRSLLEKLPDVGSPYRFTTENYDKNYGAFDTSNWATSFMWDLDGDNPYSSTVYAIPLAFRASVDGGAKNVMQVTAPSSNSDAANNVYTMQMPSNATMTDFLIHTPFETSSAKVDAVTDWSYDVVMEKTGDSSTYMKTTMVQGSIFGYFELVNADTLKITRGKGLPAKKTYENADGNIIVIRCFDNQDEDYDYYAFYGAAGTQYEIATKDAGLQIDSINMNFRGNAYFSLAYLGSSKKNPDDAWGEKMCKAYQPYAYNFVTDTRAEYAFDEASNKLRTVYSYAVDRKAESGADGTIMGVLPHQYKNILPGASFLEYTYATVRGVMKTMAGSSFTTELSYSGILPFMPDYTEDVGEKAVLKGYLDEYKEQFGNNYFGNYEGTGDTYWDGKGMNRLSNAMASAYAAGDTASAESMFNALKTRLEEWFTYSGSSDTTYFYYDDGVGALFGFPQSYDSVNQINDHHFHYGYFIYAAAQIAFRDQAWAQQYGGMVEELINDIACPVRNSASSKYPYLRSFAPYEGHSWASGHANFDMGNNQESSSEALNAWAGIILWGEATGNKQLRDLGIYLYTTEVSAVQNYWYDTDEDVLSDAYRYNVSIAEAENIDKNNREIVNNSAAIVWGGSYTYATWFSANPLHIQGINLLPMNPTCFYLAGDKDYIKQNYELAYRKAALKDEWNNKEWVDIWCQYYAMAFPEEALAKWKQVEEAEGSYGVEGGDTKAHTYHFIKALCTFGTPDTAITSDTVLSSVFVKDGVKTYCAYNAGTSPKTVTFSDGYQITVAPGSMGVEEEGSGPGKKKYSIEHYVENISGTYDLFKTESKYGEIGNEVEVTEPRDFTGYAFDSENKGNILKAELTQEGNTVLKLYYNRRIYQITYRLDADVKNEGNPSSYKYGEAVALKEPEWEGRHFIGWYTDEACSTAFEGISATTTGDFTLWAKWLVTGNDEAFYKVEYYKETEEGSGSYALAETETLVGKIGSEVTAEARSYEGYMENTEHGERKVSGTVLEDGSLVLKLYYMVGEPETPEGFGYYYDASAGKATFYYAGAAGGLIYIAVYDSKETAQQNAKNANATPPGFDQVPGHAGYPMTTGAGQAEFELAVAEGKYFVYAFNPDNQGIQSWYVGQAAEKQPPATTDVNYTVKYYQQNTTLDGYTEAAVVNASGSAGTTVNAEIRSYPGFTHNNAAEGSLLEGELTEGAELELRVYYDRNKYPVVYHNLEGGQNPEANAAEYIYGVGLVFQNPVKPGFRFEGWYEDEGCETTPITAIDKERTEAVNVYAKWKEQTQPAAYVVKYYLESLMAGRYEEVPADRFEGTGFVGDEVFADKKEYPGYVLNESAEEGALSGVLSSEETIVLKVYFDRKKYGITYHNMENAQNPEANKSSYRFGTGFILQKPYRENYIFDGWYLDQHFSAGNEITEIMDLQTGELDLYAKWIREQAQYSVRYYLQNRTLDGYEEATQLSLVKTADAGVQVDARKEGLVQELDGFILNQKESRLKGTVDKKEHLTLKIYYDRKEYSVVYANMEGARNHPENAESYIYGVGLTLHSPEKEGLIFAGWYLDEACTEENKIVSISGGVSGDITVYAKWIEQSKAAPYTVHYYLQDTHLHGYQEAEQDLFTGEGEIGTKVLAPVKEYQGFSVNENAQGFLKSGTVKEDGSLELNIYYDRCSYEIIYHNIKDAVNPAANKTSYIYGIGFTLRNPVKEEYVFEGWFTNEYMEDESKVNKIKDDQWGDIHLYAKWKKYTPSQEEPEEEEYDFKVETIEDQYYTGAKIVPDIVVKDGEKILAEKKDYTVKITNNVNAGTAKVKITGKGNYGGILEKTFQILPKDIQSDEMNADDIYTAYRKGKNIKVKPKLTWGKKTLKSGKDYVIEGPAEYSQTGVYNIVLEGRGNYTGKRALRFEITDQVLMSSVKVGKIEKQYYRGGQEITPELLVTYRGEVLVENTDYTVEYRNNMQAGTAAVVLTGIGGKYVGEKKVSFKIEGMDLKKMQFALYRQEYEYTGTAVFPEYFSGSLKAGRDFTVTYSNNKKAGTGTVTFTGMGAYSGTLKKTFKIVPYNVANNAAGFFEDTQEEIVADYVKGGSKPALELKFRGKVLTEGTDYTLKYKNNNAVGEAEITVTGKGSFTGSYTKSFTVTKADLDEMIITAEDVLYKPGQKTTYYMPKVTVMDKNGKKLSAGKDYDKKFVYSYETQQGEVEFDRDSRIGDLPLGTVLKVTLNGMGNYKGEASLEYTVVPASIKSASVTIVPQEYTGEPIILDKADITVVAGGRTLGKDQFEIVEGSYLNNNKKGTAKVTLHGIGEYGGYKTVSFKIGQRSIKDIIAGIFGRK